MSGSNGPPEIQSSEIMKSEKIGEGAFGIVYRGQCRAKTVAIKVLRKQKMQPQELAKFRMEVAIASKIYHPNIVLFMGACTEEGEMAIVTEFLPKGDLRSLLSVSRDTLSLYTRMNMANDCALAMNWLHGSNPKIIHRDLKTPNLLVDKHYRIKVCDFGLAEFRDRQLETWKDEQNPRGTPLWMAPEVLLRRNFNEKADVYSFGLMLWEILTGQLPLIEFENYTLNQFVEVLCRDKIRPVIPDDTNLLLKQLIEDCWQHEPTLRPSFPQIVDRFRTILIQSAIQDPTGQEFWQTSFQYDTGNAAISNLKKVVSWDQFWTAFLRFEENCNRNAQKRLQQQQQQQQQHQVPLPPSVQDMNPNALQLQDLVSLGANRPQLAPRGNQDAPRGNQDAPQETKMRCLQALLAEKQKEPGITTSKNEDGEVHIEKFGRILQWFRPIVDSTGRLTLLDKVTLLLSKPWFHGDLSTEDASARLSSQQVETFLVRFSSSQPGCYTISKVGSDKILHQRVSPFEQLIEATNKWEKSCPGSPYTKLFSPTKSEYIEVPIPIP